MSKAIKSLKRYVKACLPMFVILKIRKIRIGQFSKKWDQRFLGKADSEIFSTIYSKKLWGGGERDFSSGHGSVDSKYIDPYVKSVNKFLSSLSCKPNVVDFGCGDFGVGSNFLKNVQNYIACDVAENIINRNIIKYDFPNLSFHQLDIANDALPPGDVVFVRQVLQHLSNETIQRFLENLIKMNYKYLILSEFIPDGHFVSNVNIKTGPCSRLAQGIRSGVVLTDASFYLKVKKTQCIAKVKDELGVLETILYEL